MEVLWQSWHQGAGWDDNAAQSILRLTVALLLGAVIGYDREVRGRAAGLRTHMLISLGAALYTLVAVEATERNPDLAAIVKGVATGIGFLGAGTILKRHAADQIEGLTTAAGVWLTGAIGFAVGVGWLIPAVTAVLLAVFTLRVVTWISPDVAQGDQDQ